MEFERISFEEKSGRNSKQIETYNFHKAASVLAEYGFDCIRLSNDWHWADFLAHHRDTGRTLSVQLKTCLHIDRKFDASKDLYICFTLDGTGNWYLLRYDRLMEIVQEASPHWLGSNRWHSQDHYFSYRGNKAIREALNDYAYSPSFANMGFREAAESATE